jgi:endonuclease YncB( thermonuclease family)
MTKFIFILAAFFAVQPNIYAQKTFEATIVSIHDGDSYRVIPDGSSEQTVVRLWGVDCPEVKSGFVSENQEYGTTIRDTMIAKFKGQKLHVQILYKDVYGRNIAKISYKSVDFTDYLITSGGAWFYPAKYMSKEQKKYYTALQKTAQDSKRGLWSLDGEKINPAQFRKTHKPKKT